MPSWDDDEEQITSARSSVALRAHDVALARRAAPSFGGGPDDPSTLESLRRFTRRYGWRAYALPILTVITVVALTTAGSEAQSTVSAAGARSAAAKAKALAAPTTEPQIALKSDRPAAGSLDTVLAATALPAGASYTKTGTGKFRILPGRGPAVGAGKIRRYSVDVEQGVTGVDLAQFAAQVQSVLSDPRSWAGHGGVLLQRVDTGPADFHVTLTSSDTVHKMCGHALPIETSCFAPAGHGATDVNRVLINVSRWVRGDAAYVGDRGAYRIYLINHEDGHALGHQHAHQCLPGGLAPVMMQQTIGLRSAATHTMCQANPWPYPQGAEGAPGAEQPDTPANNAYGLEAD